MTVVEESALIRRSDQLFQLADGQAGYFTQKQAAALGYSRPLQHHYRRTGEWLHLGWGIYRLKRYPVTPDEELVRLSLWSRTQQGEVQATVSHETALRLYDLSDLAPAHLHLTVPPGFRKTPPPGLVLHRGVLTSRDVQRVGGYRLTTPLRTLLDLAAGEVSPEHYQQAVREALQQGLVRQQALEAALPTLPEPAQSRLLAALEPG